MVTVTVKGPNPNDKSLPTSDESQSNPLMRGYHQAEFNLGPSFHQANCDKQERLAKTLCCEFFLSLEPAWNPLQAPSQISLCFRVLKPLSEACEAFSSCCGWPPLGLEPFSDCLTVRNQPQQTVLFVDLSESFFLLDWKCKINGKRSYPRILEVFHDFMSILEAFHLSLLDFDPKS